jgi:hypothetical protein
MVTKICGNLPALSFYALLRTLTSITAFKICRYREVVSLTPKPQRGGPEVTFRNADLYTSGDLPLDTVPAHVTIQVMRAEKPPHHVILAVL